VHGYTTRCYVSELADQQERKGKTSKNKSELVVTIKYSTTKKAAPSSVEQPFLLLNILVKKV
jgi:hypothetical protein